MSKKSWTHKVVKQQRGTKGEWFSHSAAMTGSEQEAREYAESFAKNQRDSGVVGTRITVQSRGGKLVQSIAV